MNTHNVININEFILKILCTRYKNMKRIFHHFKKKKKFFNISINEYNDVIYTVTALNSSVSQIYMYNKFGYFNTCEFDRPSLDCRECM